LKQLISLFILFHTLVVFSQNNDKRHFIEYANMSSLSINSNYENYYSKAYEEKRNGTSVGFDINTIHGIKFFELVSVSAGISFDWNINESFISTPYIIDFRIFSSRSNQNGLFAFIQTGKNIKWSDSFSGNGVTAKLGVGVIVNRTENSCFYLELFKKSKQIETEDFQEKGYYNLNSYGISLGLTFN
jgi:thioredoxin-related protein